MAYQKILQLQNIFVIQTIIKGTIHMYYVIEHSHVHTHLLTQYTVFIFHAIVTSLGLTPNSKFLKSIFLALSHTAFPSLS